MARWCHLKPNETRALLLTDFWMLDGFLKRNPPVDIIAAAVASHRFGLKINSSDPSTPKGEFSIREAARRNSGAFRAIPTPKNLPGLPTRLAGAASLLDKMKAEWQATGK